MRKLVNVLAALVVLALATQCGQGGGGGANPLAEQAEKLLNTWGFNTDNSTLIDGDWSGFELAIPTASENGGTFQISNASTGFEVVWTNGGDSWGFMNGRACWKGTATAWKSPWIEWAKPTVSLGA